MIFIDFFQKFLLNMVMPSIPMSILCCISIYILHRGKISLSHIKKYLLLSFVTGMVLTTGSYMIILPILSVITIAELNSSKNKNIIKILITIYCIYFLNAVYVFFYAFSGSELNGNVTISLKYMLTEFVVLLIIVIPGCMIINAAASRKATHKELSPSMIRFRMILIICIPMALFIYLIYPLIFFINKQKVDFILSNFFPQILPLIAIILTCIIVYNYDKSVEYRVKLKREIDEKREIEEYSHVIEDMYSETRRFKHDYINMLSPLKEYIDDSDMKGLRSFFYSNIIDMDKDIKWNNSNIDKLKYIKITGLKAILSTKLIKAVSLNIDIKVEIVEDILNIDMNIMDLCRITGILMDNAIEAAVECEYPKISTCIVNRNDYTVISVQNNYFGEKPVIHRIYEEGFSTKGSGRGLGLYTVKHIIDTEYDNVFINTSAEDKMFIQELWIKSIHN